MEQHLATRAFFVGERYTIADIALYAYTHVAHEGGFDLAPFPALRAGSSGCASGRITFRSTGFRRSRGRWGRSDHWRASQADARGAMPRAADVAPSGSIGRGLVSKASATDLALQDLAVIARRNSMKSSTTAKRRTAPGSALPEGELRKLDALWRASNYLSVGQIYLLDNPLLQRAARARARQAASARALGHDAGPELPLRAPESGHQAARPGHDLRHRPGTRRPGARRERLSRRDLQRGLSRTSARTKRG